MGKGHLTKAELEARDQFDAEVKYLAECGYDKEEIMELLDCNKNKVSFALHRIEFGNSMNYVNRGSEKQAEQEAQLLIDAKLAPVHTPKVHKVQVNGWENGKYVHYEAYDVSEFWGL